MPIAIINGILTSIILETILLLRTMPFKEALKMATGIKPYKYDSHGVSNEFYRYILGCFNIVILITYTSFSRRIYSALAL